tara:strand:+ start:833 stop:1465 length:633 start_codon:yes stop_codon:yes gene_type:complete
MKNLADFRNNVHSQNGEDGVIEEILNRLGISSGTFCEFGAWDGVHLSNTFNLVENGSWSGVYIEGDSSKFNDLLETKKKYPDRLTCINKFVSVDGDDSLDMILKTTDLESNFDLLSIDIDSFDYQVWESLSEYTPKIVIIEVNSGAGGQASQIHTCDDAGNVIVQGSSYMSTLVMGVTKGYTCIYHHGNMIFLHNSLFDEEKFSHGYFDW